MAYYYYYYYIQFAQEKDRYVVFVWNLKGDR